MRNSTILLGVVLLFGCTPEENETDGTSGTTLDLTTEATTLNPTTGGTSGVMVDTTETTDSGPTDPSGSGTSGGPTSGTSSGSSGSTSTGSTTAIPTTTDETSVTNSTTTTDTDTSDTTSGNPLNPGDPCNPYLQEKEDTDPLDLCPDGYTCIPHLVSPHYEWTCEEWSPQFGDGSEGAACLEANHCMNHLCASGGVCQNNNNCCIKYCLNDNECTAPDVCTKYLPLQLPDNINDLGACT